MSGDGASPRSLVFFCRLLGLDQHRGGLKSSLGPWRPATAINELPAILLADEWGMAMATFKGRATLETKRPTRAMSEYTRVDGRRDKPRRS